MTDSAISRYRRVSISGKVFHVCIEGFTFVAIALRYQTTSAPSWNSFTSWTKDKVVIGGENSLYNVFVFLRMYRASWVYDFFSLWNWSRLCGCKGHTIGYQFLFNLSYYTLWSGRMNCTYISWHVEWPQFETLPNYLDGRFHLLLALNGKRKALSYCPSIIVLVATIHTIINKMIQSAYNTRPWAWWI